MFPLPVANNQYQAPMIDQPPAPVPDGHLEVDAPRTGEPSPRGHHQQSGPRVSPHCRRAGPRRSARYFAALAGTDDVPKAVLIASAFHDLGIWTDRTFDYFAPSIRHAHVSLKANDLAHLEPEVHGLIEHPQAAAFYRRILELR